MNRFLAAATGLALLASSSPGAFADGRRCFGRRPTIAGTADSDVIVGTRGADVIVARGGDDRVDGGGGNDRICGGDGNDRLFGGSGADRIQQGRSGWEEIANGGPGPDLLLGGSRNANCDGYWELRGEDGDDRLLAEPGTVCLSMFGGYGDDELDTGDGSATLIGGPGDDAMTGEGRFEGGAGNDDMQGRGFSRALFDDPGGVRVDLERGVAVGPGEGRDTIEGITALETTEGDDLVYGDGEANVVFAGGGDDRVFGGGGDDVLEGREGDDEMDGGEGNDSVSAAPGTDLLTGGPGDDTLSNSYVYDSSRPPGRSAFDGGDGRDRITLYLQRGPIRHEDVTIDLMGTSSIGDQPLALASLEDVDLYSEARVEIRGDEGPNWFRVEAPDVVLDGRGGDDTIDAPSSRDAASIQGGEGFDSVEFGPYAVTVDLVEGTFVWEFPAYGGTVAGFERLVGGLDADTFRGDDGPNVFEGIWGNDVIEGRGGDDVLNGGLGDDSLDGGDGNDSLDGDEGNDECVNGESVQSCEAG